MKPRLITLEVNEGEITKLLNASFGRVTTDFAKKGGMLDKMASEALLRAFRPIMRKAMTGIAQELSGEAMAKADRAIKKMMLEIKKQ